MPYLEFNINSEIVFPDSAIPIFLSKYIKTNIESAAIPKKFLLYCPNLFVNSKEKNVFENQTTLEIVSFVSSEQCDQIHEEIYNDMKECYSKLSIKTRYIYLYYYFLFFLFLYFFIYLGT